MTHPKYGVRYACFQCGTKFYDMNKPDPVCPKCAADQRKAPKKQSSKSTTKSAAPVDYDSDSGSDDNPDSFGSGFSEDRAADQNIKLDEIPDESGDDE